MEGIASPIFSLFFLIFFAANLSVLGLFGCLKAKAFLVITEFKFFALQIIYLKSVESFRKACWVLSLIREE